jgi:hypothetical protein
MPDLTAFQDQFLALIDRPDAPLSPLAVYRNTSLSGLSEALFDNFPVVCELVGEELFGALALDFAQSTPPGSPILALYGAGFADWLADQPVGRDISYLADVARCERAHIEALFAADAPALGIGDIAAIAPDALLAMPFALHPAARFGWQATPGIDIWLAHRNRIDSEIVIDWRAAGYLFTRPELETRARPIDRPAHRLLHGLRLGETLGEAAAATLTLYPATDIGALFASLVATGAFTTDARRNAP